ncbi:pcs60p [Nannochloropsis gaditana]|uniref:Pcs60p n=1 Tax=Nannochloropsis gaditana TaxID=72520 RepID=W7TM69_9STRA|nr:pcs60p [Nannochloropsis gaditana]
MHECFLWLCAQTTHQRHRTYTKSMASTFVAPRTLRDVPHAESYPPGHSALVIPATPETPSYEVSYTALAHAVATVGKQLIPLLPAEKSEKVVALAMPNTLAFPLGFLGAIYGGAAMAPLNPDYKEEEFRFYLEA